MKKIISDNKRGLGRRIASRFSAGDIVKWKGWFLNDIGGHESESYYGVLVDIIEEEVGGRQVVYGLVLPFKNNITFQINMTSLKKVEQ